MQGILDLVTLTCNNAMVFNGQVCGCCPSRCFRCSLGVVCLVPAASAPLHNFDTSVWPLLVLLYAAWRAAAQGSDYYKYASELMKHAETKAAGLAPAQVCTRWTSVSMMRARALYAMLMCCNL